MIQSSFRSIWHVLLLWLVLSSCSLQRRIQQEARQTLGASAALQRAHWGASIYEPATGKYWYNRQGDQYFVPASNIKIPTCYAAMKFLGDSLLSALVQETPDTLFVEPCGDPTFLNQEFAQQPLWQRMVATARPVVIGYSTKNRVTAFGSGWSWDDYQEAYLAERSVMPVYANVVRFVAQNNQLSAVPSLVLRPPYLKEGMIQQLGKQGKFAVSRSPDENLFYLVSGNQPFTRATIPYKTVQGVTNFIFLQDTLARVGVGSSVRVVGEPLKGKPVYSQPVDSLLKPLMHRSDNFYAEQSLLMVSQRLLGYMSDKDIIDTLLKTELADLPQRPRWVDGSGLSRYNLFTPQDLVSILDRMQRSFGTERVKAIFPGANEGTLSGYYKEDSGYIYAKTGTLSGVVALSGFLQTRRGRQLVFSVLVNNHQATATEVRRRVEAFLQRLRRSF